MLKKIIFTFICLSLLALAIVSLGSYFAWKYPIELLTHFRVQYLVISLVLTAILVILNIQRYFPNKLFIFCALILVGLNGIEVIPWYLPHSQQFTANTSESNQKLGYFS